VSLNGPSRFVASACSRSSHSVSASRASGTGPRLADTECEDLEQALATNLLGPFRLTKALLGALADAARHKGAAVVVNVSSDAAVTAYPEWGAYGASKAALRHMTNIWNAEFADHGVGFLSIDPGDMDTPLHALAIPDADRSTLKRPETAAVEIADAIAAALTIGRSAKASADPASGSGPALSEVEGAQREAEALT